jgi:hypothetical protein
MRLEATERVAEERWSGLEFRLGQIDAALERLEKRIWVGVYGVAAFFCSARWPRRLLRLQPNEGPDVEHSRRA